MTQNEKELLLKDLCARLPYGVKVHEDIQGDFTLIGLMNDRVLTSCEVENHHNNFPIDIIKPYLFPLSSMTEEQKKEYRKVCELDTEILSKHPMDETPFPALYNSQDWLNKHHFDYRGLISKGLAIDATGLNIY